MFYSKGTDNISHLRRDQQSVLIIWHMWKNLMFTLIVELWRIVGDHQWRSRSNKLLVSVKIQTHDCPTHASSVSEADLLSHHGRAITSSQCPDGPQLRSYPGGSQSFVTACVSRVRRHAWLHLQPVIPRLPIYKYGSLILPLLYAALCKSFIERGMGGSFSNVSIIAINIWSASSYWKDKPMDRDRHKWFVAFPTGW